MSNIRLLKQPSGFNFKEWVPTRPSYSKYDDPPHKPGVYAITNTELLEDLEYWGELEILYVGSAANLYKRYSHHEVYRVLKRQYEYINFWWREDGNYLETERLMVQSIQPKFNKQLK